MWPGTCTKRSLPSRNRAVSAGFLLLVLTLGVLSLTGSGRYRLGVWKAVALGGSSAPSWRTALVETAPYRYQPRLRRWLGPEAPQIAAQLEMPPHSAATATSPLSKTAYISQTVWSADLLNIHYSRLEAGELAHEIHRHEEEELLVPISGEVEILGLLESRRIGPGKALYYASNDPHTIRALGPGPSTYLVWRWRSAAGAAGEHLRGEMLNLEANLQDGLERAASGESVKHQLLDGETRWLGRLYLHLRSLPAGGVIAAHEDDHDAVLVLLEGTIETQCQTLTAPAVSFNPAFSEHGVKNPGPGVAQYIAADMTPR